MIPNASIVMNVNQVAAAMSVVIMIQMEFAQKMPKHALLTLSAILRANAVTLLIIQVQVYAPVL